MKRVIAFLILILFLAGCKIVSLNNVPDFDFESLIIISLNSSLYDTSNIQNGNQYYYEFDKKSGEKALQNLQYDEIEGIVYYFEKDYDIKQIKNKLDFCFEGEKVDDIEIVYGYDKNYPDFRYINGKKVNVQIAENSTNIVVGYPLILCGY